MQRRTFLIAAAALVAGAAGANPPPTLTVARSPACGCCGAWIEHMRAAGFEVEVHELAPDALADLKRRVGLRPEHASCHTATVQGYVVEGHVPAADVERLLAERPQGLGLAVPGMPVGSPGMEMGDRREPFDTLLIGVDGRARVFARHR